MTGGANMRVPGKVAIVTGGAAGLGASIACRLVGDGAQVVITDIQTERGRATAKEIGAEFLEQDVGDEAQWLSLIDAVERRFGGLHILVNNAGIAEAGAAADPETTLPEDWRCVMRTNAESVFLGCRAAIPAMRRSSGGSIVNMSSIAALVGTPFLTAYGASKAAVRQLTMSVALHCAQKGYGIRCNSVHPGQIRTPMHDALLKDTASAADAPLLAVEAEFRSRIPLGVFGVPDDIANAVLYLASDESRHVTGAKLVVDGGMQIV